LAFHVQRVSIGAESERDLSQRLEVEQQFASRQVDELNVIRSPPDGRIDAADAVGADPHTLEAASAGSHRHAVNLSGFSDETGGAETRPKNAYVLYLVKY
jgi:hypothetical protein